MNVSMKATEAQEYGSQEVLVFGQAERPEHTDDHVLIQLKAAGVNPADWKFLAGLYKQFVPLQFPWSPGVEGAGVIEAVGSNVTTFKKGDEVYGIVTGGYAEYALALASDVQPKPANLTFEEAASVPMGA